MGLPCDIGKILSFSEHGPRMCLKGQHVVKREVVTFKVCLLRFFTQA